MAVQRWYPFGSVRRHDDAFDGLSRGFFGREYRPGDSNGWTVPVDIVEEGQVLVHASVPGIDPSEIDVTVDGDVLTIRGSTARESETQEGSYVRRELQRGAFSRALRLSDTVDRDNIRPSYENGVLTIALPKTAATKAKRLPIAVGGGDAAGAA